MCRVTQARVDAASRTTVRPLLARLFAPLSAPLHLAMGVAAGLAVAVPVGLASPGPGPDDGLLIGMDYTANDTAVPLYVRLKGEGWLRVMEGVPIWGMAADNQTCTIYITSTGGSLYRYRFGEFNFNQVSTVRVDGTVTAMPGLAFNAGRLYGAMVTGTEGIFEINIETGVATRVCTTNSGYDFSGIDFDPDTGILYGVTDTAPVGGTPGLYRIDLPTGNATFIAGYPTPFPGAGTIPDVDGLAVGNGAAYMIVDQPGNIAKYTFATGTYTQFANPWTLSRTLCAGAFAPCFAVEPCRADIDQSGGVDGSDVALFFSLYEQGLIDIDRSGGTDAADIAYFFERFEAGC